MKKLNLTEAPKTVAFTFGRFNPPTTGHEKLCDAVKKANPSDYKIFASKSQNPKKDPLQYAKKIAYMKKSFPKHKRNIIVSKSRNIFEILVELNSYENLIMVVGSDRVAEFEKIINEYNGVKARHGFYEYKTVQVLSAGERDPDAEGIEGMSASKMRAAAADSDFDSFKLGTPLRDTDAKKLYFDVRKSMGVKEELDLTDYEVIRDLYLSEQIWNVGELIKVKGKDDNTYPTWEIIRKGTNYVAVIDENYDTRKIWLHDIDIDDVASRLDGSRVYPKSHTTKEEVSDELLDKIEKAVDKDIDKLEKQFKEGGAGSGPQGDDRGQYNTDGHVVTKVVTDKKPSRVRKIVQGTKDKLNDIKKKLGQEKEETKEMLSIYKKSMKAALNPSKHGKPSPEEVKKANNQFKDVLKGVGMGALSALPIPGTALVLPTIVRVVKKKTGINLLPSSFDVKEELELDENIYTKSLQKASDDFKRRSDDFSQAGSKTSYSVKFAYLAGLMKTKNLTSLKRDLKGFISKNHNIKDIIVKTLSQYLKPYEVKSLTEESDIEDKDIIIEASVKSGIPYDILRKVYNDEKLTKEEIDMIKEYWLIGTPEYDEYLKKLTPGENLNQCSKNFKKSLLKLM
jgi:hypothetical protein